MLHILNWLAFLLGYVVLAIGLLFILIAVTFFVEDLHWTRRWAAWRFDRGVRTRDQEKGWR